MGGVGLIPPKGGAGKEEGQRSPGNQTVGSEGPMGFTMGNSRALLLSSRCGTVAI